MPATTARWMYFMGTRYPKFSSEVAARTAVCVDCNVWQGGNNSVVECDLAKVEVAGSNPVSRSKIYRRGPLHPAWRVSRAGTPEPRCTRLATLCGDLDRVSTESMTSIANAVNMHMPIRLIERCRRRTNS